MRTRLAAALTAAAMAAGCTPAPDPAGQWTLPIRREVPPATVRVLAVGDSRTSSGQWPTELARLLDAAGVPHQVDTVGVGGTDCRYWVDKIQAILVAHNPDVFVLACGTNDNPDQRVYGEPVTGWAFRSIVEQVHAYRPAAPVVTIPVLIQYSDPILAPRWLLSNEPRTNDILYREMRRHWDWWPSGVADMQVIPATATYLAADPYPSPAGQIGIHPTPRGARYMARIVYDRGAAAALWPTSGDPPLCDLYGHRDGYPRPTGPDAKPCLD